MQLGRRPIPVIPVHIWGDEDSIPTFVPLGIEVRREFLEPAMAGASAMPKDVIYARSKGLRATKMQNPGWKLVRNDVCLVGGDVGPTDLKAVSVLALELHVMLRSYLGGRDSSRRTSIKIFKDELQYRHMARLNYAPNAEAYYNPQTTEIVHWFGAYATPLLFQRAFAHEFTHAYVDLFFRRLEPVWLMEGIAEWFSNLEWRGDIFVPGQMSRYSLQVLSLHGPASLSIKNLTTVSRDEIYGIRFQSYYAQAWSFVDYLMTQLPYRAVEGILNGDLFDFASHQEAWEAHVHMMLSAAGF